MAEIIILLMRRVKKSVVKNPYRCNGWNVVLLVWCEGMLVVELVFGIDLHIRMTAGLLNRHH